MKNAIIFHGAGNDSQGNWFPWLKHELEEKGYAVFSPNLPNSEYPVLKDWLNTVDLKHWPFNEETVLAGHSAGATFILRLLEHLPDDIMINKAVLVAGPVRMGTKQELYQHKKEMVQGDFNWKKIKDTCKHFYFIHSDNDQYECGAENGIIMQRHLGGELIIKNGEGHFNLEKGPEYKQFPLILELIEKE